MSEFPPSSTSANTVQTAAYADAVQRAKVVAAKIDYSGKKRPLEDPKVYCPKKLAISDSSSDYQLSGSMGDAVAGVGVGARAPGGAPGGMSQQMAPDLNINEYMRVPDKMVGLIIGRNGEQINRLQAESGCKIQMAPDSGGQPDRVCTLTGSRDAVTKAKEMINTIVNQRGRDGGPPDNGPSQRMGQNYISKEEMMIPGAKVGLIIGKGGETIKQLQERSGAKMVVIQDGPNPEYEKPLRITGDPQKVEYAKQLVLELIEDKEQYGGGGGRGGGPNKQSNSNSAPWGGSDDCDQNNPDGHEVLVPKNAVGVVIGKGGDMIKKIQSETGAKVQFRQLYAEVQGDQRCFLQGTPQQVQQARDMISLLISSVNSREQEGRQRGPPRNGDGGSYGSWGGGQDNKIEVSFTVSNVKCGIIIGRGGEVIKQINAQSGAFCELDRRTQNNQNRGNRTFYIRGTPETVEAAKRIITEKVGMPISFVDSNSSQGNDGNGGSGNGGGNGNGSDYGGGYGGGQNTPVGNAQMWTYNPSPWHPSQHQQQETQPQQQTVPINTVTNQPDYSQQWIDYYRSMGMDQEADKIEQQQKASKVAAVAVAGQQPSQHPQSVVSTNGGNVPSVGVPNVATARSSQPQPDYSAQWVEYYRSTGKIKEAEAVEAQMKQKAEAEAAGRASANLVANSYGAAGGASYQPQPYQQQHYANYNPYPGYPGHQPHPAPPDQQQ